jgi:hypothetical protein
METGIDKKQIEAIKRFGSRLTSEPARLKMAVCVVLAGVGFFGVERPLGERLEAARTANAKAKTASKKAAEAVLYTKQRDLYEERVAVESRITDWQNYVLGVLGDTSAMLVSLEPRKNTSKGPFTIIEMELVAKGDSYNEFAIFVDRLERGPRIVRLDKLRMERQQGNIYLTCIVKGLIKKSAKKPKPKPVVEESQIDAEAGSQADAEGVDTTAVEADPGADEATDEAAVADTHGGTPDELTGGAVRESAAETAGGESDTESVVAGDAAGDAAADTTGDDAAEEVEDG